MLSPVQRAALVSLIHQVVPRLEGISEGEWVTDWVLKKLRVADTKRPEKGEEKKREKGRVGRDRVLITR